MKRVGSPRAVHVGTPQELLKASFPSVSFCSLQTMKSFFLGVYHQGKVLGFLFSCGFGSEIYPQTRRSDYLFFNYLFFNYMSVFPFHRRVGC